MKLQIFLASVCVFAGILMADGKDPAKGTKSSKKAPGTFSPSPKPGPADKLKVTKTTEINVQKKQIVRDALAKSAPNLKTTPDQKVALNKVLGDQPLTDGDRQQLSNLLFNAQAAGLSKEDEANLSFLLLDDTARQNAATSTSAPSSENTGPLFLRVNNKTGERLKVWVQLLPETAEKTDKKLDTLMYDLAPGKAYDLQQNGKKLQATAIHVWAMSPTRSWAHHRDEELHLTPPAKNAKTYTLTFSEN
jgi:hypothetical protein